MKEISGYIVVLKTAPSQTLPYILGWWEYLLWPQSLLIASAQLRLKLLSGMFEAEKSWHVFNLQDPVIFTNYLGSNGIMSR